ncbi:MAG: hypothetical protein KIS96_08790 [Bauldia sp.]|nr:hypothetical protein [Bauldia sp.]
MPEQTMDEILSAIGDAHLIAFEEIAREAHRKYRGYDAAILIELDVRAQAACTYAHMQAGADRRFLDQPGIRLFDIRGLKLWHFETANVVVRLKKMDEDGRSRSYPTKQAKDFDNQLELPGLPAAPVRLTAGYLLDRTGTQIERAQIARPIGKRTEWCAAILPADQRTAGERVWEDVTRQARF